MSEHAAQVAVVVDTLTAHSIDRDGSKTVWLPNVKCLCGDVMLSSWYRRHLAERIVDALGGVS